MKRPFLTTRLKTLLLFFCGNENFNSQQRRRVKNSHVSLLPICTYMIIMPKAYYDCVHRRRREKMRRRRKFSCFYVYLICLLPHIFILRSTQIYYYYYICFSCAYYRKGKQWLCSTFSCFQHTTTASSLSLIRFEAFFFFFLKLLLFY